MIRRIELSGILSGNANGMLLLDNQSLFAALAAVWPVKDVSISPYSNSTIPGTFRIVVEQVVPDISRGSEP